MKTPISASIGFGILWLFLIIMLTLGQNIAGGLAIFAVLAAFVGFKRAYLMRWGNGIPVAAALAFGAGLNYGPYGGAAVGVIAIIAQNIGCYNKLSPHRLFGYSAFIAAVGLFSGYTFVFLYGAESIPSIFNIWAAMFVSAIICWLIVLVFDYIVTSKFICSSTSGQGAALSQEFALGIGLAALAQIFFFLWPIESLLLLAPIAYLVKQLLYEIMSKLSPENKSENLVDVYSATINALVAAIDARDRFTRTHTSNVVNLSVEIARVLDLSDDQVESLKTAALFHDIGKLWVPEHILLRPGKLDPDQFAKIQCHPALGQKILDKVHFPWPIGSIIRSHHEWWDGTGYPDRLKGDEIPLESRILSIADVCDAMSSKRLYRPSNTFEETINYITEAGGSQFDPTVVEAFKQVVAEKNFLHQKNSPEEHESESQIAAKENFDIQDDGSRTSSEFIAIYEIAKAASTSLDLDRVLHLLAAKINSMVSCSTCVIFLREETSDILESKIALGTNLKYFQNSSTAIGRGQTGLVAHIGQGIIAEYDHRDVKFACAPRIGNQSTDWVDMNSVMTVPIIASGGVIGTINVYHTKENAFSDEDLHLLTVVSPQIGRAIQNALLFKMTTESALTDIVTGCHNARYMFIQLEQLMERAKNLQTPISVLCMDLDNFKAINDAFGHQEGDLVLKEVSDMFRTQVRDNDLVCRYAGDEFIIILPDADNKEALITAQRIEKLIDNHTPYGTGENQVKVGVSIGVATFPKDGQDVHSLIARADFNMYADKKRRKRLSQAA